MKQKLLLSALITYNDATCAILQKKDILNYFIYVYVNHEIKDFLLFLFQPILIVKILT